MSIGDIQIVTDELNVTVQGLPANIVAVDQGSQIKIIQIASLAGNTTQIATNEINVNVVTSPQNVVLINPNSPKVIEVAGGPPGPVGPAGPQGPQGAGAAFIGIAGVVISGGIAVIEENGLIYPADPTNINHANLMVGISAGGALQGANVSVLQAGLLEGETYPAANLALYVGLNGILSVNPAAPGAAWRMRVGTSRDNVSMIIVLQPPIQLN